MGRRYDERERADVRFAARRLESKWGTGKVARGKKVVVTYKGRTVVGELRDTMPKKANIKNGAGIDLNPGFAKEFGVKPPFMLKNVEWEWE